MCRPDALLHLPPHEGVAVNKCVHRHHGVHPDVAVRKPGARDAPLGQHHGQIGERGRYRHNNTLSGRNPQVSLQPRHATQGEQHNTPVFVGREKRQGRHGGHHARCDGLHEHGQEQGGRAYRDRTAYAARRSDCYGRRNRRQHKPAPDRKHILQELAAA